MIIAKGNQVFFTVPLLPPSVNHCYLRNKNGGLRLGLQGKAYCDAVALLGPKRMVEGEFYEVQTLFRVQKRQIWKVDAENYCKVATDSLVKAGIIRDDRYIVRGSFAKVEVGARNEEGTEFTILGL